MNNFDVGSYIAEQAQALPQAHIVEGIPFDLLSLELDIELYQAVEQCTSYDTMVLLAADNGLAYYDNDDEAYRVIDNKRLSKKIQGLWKMEELQLDSDPCIKERVGKIVCEISGLSECLSERKELDALEEEDKPTNPEVVDGVLVVDGDKPFDEQITVDELYEDKNAAQVD